MDKKKKRKSKQFHEDLEGFNIKINEFGEIVSNMDVDKLNAFLSEHVEDEKVKDARKQDEEE